MFNYVQLESSKLIVNNTIKTDYYDLQERKRNAKNRKLGVLFAHVQRRSVVYWLHVEFSNSTSEMVSNHTLMKIAGLGGFVTAGTGYAFHYRVQQDIKKSDTYKFAINALHAHKKAVPYLGEPITMGRITYGDGQQMLGEKIRNYKWFKVSLTGTNTKGKLYYEVILNCTSENKSEISKIEIVFDNIPGKTFVIKECEIC
nr:PREDICTED: uncharacterized protein LOC105671458 [Linepithema humile]